MIHISKKLLCFLMIALNSVRTIQMCLRIFHMRLKPQNDCSLRNFLSISCHDTGGQYWSWKHKKNDIKKELIKNNDNWNDWRLQIHWNKLEWGDQKRCNQNINPIWISSFNFILMIKIWHGIVLAIQKINTIDIGEFLKRKTPTMKLNHLYR